MFIINLKVFIEHPLHAKHYANVPFIGIILPHYFPNSSQHTFRTHTVTLSGGNLCYSESKKKERRAKESKNNNNSNNKKPNQINKQTKPNKSKKAH